MYIFEWGHEKFFKMLKSCFKYENAYYCFISVHLHLLYKRFGGERLVRTYKDLIKLLINFSKTTKQSKKVETLKKTVVFEGLNLIEIITMTIYYPYYHSNMAVFYT